MNDILHEFLAVELRRIAQPLQVFIRERVHLGVFRSIDPAIGASGLRGLVPLPLRAECHTLATAIVDVLLDDVRAPSA